MTTRYDIQSRHDHDQCERTSGHQWDIVKRHDDPKRSGPVTIFACCKCGTRLIRHEYRMCGDPYPGGPDGRVNRMMMNGGS